MNQYPQNDLEYHEVKVVAVDGNTEHGWNFRGSDGWLFGVDKDSQIVPEVGMTARFYGPGHGAVVRGLFLDGIKVYYRTVEEQRANDEEWKRQYDAECERRKLEPKNPDPQIPGFEWDDEMAEISGFGSSYEQACRKMVSQGCRWWSEHPEAQPIVKGFERIFGVVICDNDDAKALEEAMMKGVEGCTGAMHQGALNHIFAWHKMGRSWDAYREKSKQIHRERLKDEVISGL